MHGAELLKALRAELPAGAELRAFGVGGPRLREAGLEAVVDARELLAMGFFEVLGRLPRIFGALEAVSKAAEREKPDVAVVIDYPDFHFRLARKLRELGVPVVYYIPPKLWVWRRKRARQLKALCARVLSIFPFEQDFFGKLGLPVKFVGNPLLDELPLGMSREEARRKLSLGAEDKALVIMPGSRPAELRRHVDPMLDSAVRAAALMRSAGALGKKDPLRVLIPLPATANLDAVKSRIDSWVRQASGSEPHFILDVRVFDTSGPGSNAGACLAAADVGLIKSGTATLEAALMGCPHVVAYKPNAFSCFVFQKLIRYKGPVGLVNLVAADRTDASAPRLVREIVCSEMTPRSLGDELYSLFTDSARREGIRAGLKGLRARLQKGDAGPSVTAAREVLGVLRPAEGRPG